MTLAAPIALLLLALGYPVYRAFLRKPPLPVHTVSSLLLARALAAVPTRTVRLPPEERVPLGLFLAALLLAVLAITLRPEGDTDRLIVVVPDGTSADAVAPHLHPDAATTLIATAPPRVLALDRTDPAAVLAALPPAAQSPQQDPTDLVRGLCDRDPAAAVVVIGGAPVGELPCPTTREDTPESAVLTDLLATAPDGTADLWLHLRATEPGTATLSSGDRTVGTLTLAPQPDGTAEATARVSAVPGAPLTASLPGAEPATVDVPALARARTVVVTEQPDGYLATAVRLHPRVAARIQAPGEPIPDNTDLLLTDAQAPLPQVAPVTVVFGRGAPALGVSAGRRVRDPEVQATAPDHPLLRFVAVDTLHIATGTALGTGPQDTVLATTSAGPLLVLHPTDTGQLLVAGFQLTDSDLPLRAELLHLIANLVDAAAPVPSAPTPATQPAPPTIRAAAVPLGLASRWWPLLALLLVAAFTAEAGLQLFRARR